MTPESLSLTIGSERFKARLLHDLAPQACECLLGLLPFSGKLTHARWSGEAMWASLGLVFPEKLLLPPEHPIRDPEPGEILLYAGGLSEPELYFPYAANHFACKAGPLEGSPVLRIDDRLERLAELGRGTSWRGALELRIEVSP
jgi:hypothetical protein